MSRVAVLVARLSRYGGAEGSAWRLAGELAGRGHAVSLVCARAEDEPPAGVAAVALGRPTGPKVLKMLWFAYAAARHCRRANYDLTISLGKTVVHDLARVSGGPLKVFWRLSARAWPEGLARGFKMLRRRLSPANRLALAIERRQFAPGRPLVAVSHAVRRWLVEAYPQLDEADIPVVYNLPDLTRYRPPTPAERVAARERHGLTEGETALVLAGTNFALKGLGPTIEALALLPGTCRLLVAGGRNPGRFGRLARRLGVADRVTFLGRVDDMPGLYHAADVFVLPSFYDTCANAVLEARACGLPAVSSADNGSSRCLPADWVVTDPADKRALAAAIHRAMAAGRDLPFAWPADLAFGLSPLVAMAETLLAAHACQPDASVS